MHPFYCRSSKWKQVGFLFLIKGLWNLNYVTLGLLKGIKTKVITPGCTYNICFSSVLAWLLTSIMFKRSHCSYIFQSSTNKFYSLMNITEQLMFPELYIPTGFVKIGFWLEESSPENVLALCYKLCFAAAGDPSAQVCWLANECGCSSSLPTDITDDRTETACKRNRTGNRLL